jgi:hypothetical protein
VKNFLKPDKSRYFFNAAFSHLLQDCQAKNKKSFSLRRFYKNQRLFWTICQLNSKKWLSI